MEIQQIAGGDIASWRDIDIDISGTDIVQWIARRRTIIFPLLQEPEDVKSAYTLDELTIEQIGIGECKLIRRRSLITADDTISVIYPRLSIIVLELENRLWRPWERDALRDVPDAVYLTIIVDTLAA